MNRLSRKDLEKLEQLAKTPEGKGALVEYLASYAKAVTAYENFVSVTGSPNKKRAAFIEKAKRYVEEKQGDIRILDDDDFCVAVEKSAKFVGVSTVKGVNNLHINRASALAWLLEDYSSVDLFKNPPQPEFEWGQVVTGAKFDALNTTVLDDTNVNYEEVK